MSNTISPEDLTLEEIKEQLAIYSRLYYHKKKTDVKYIEAKKQRAIETKKRRILNKILEENDKGIKLEDVDLSELEKVKPQTKSYKNKKAIIIKYEDKKTATSGTSETSEEST